MLLLLPPLLLLLLSPATAGGGAVSECTSASCEQLSEYSTSTCSIGFYWPCLSRTCLTVWLLGWLAGWLPACLPGCLAGDIADCPAACSGLPGGNASEYVPMAGSIHTLMGNSTGEKQLHASVVRMVDAVEKKFGPVTNDVAEGLHLSFQYLCCYTRAELARIETIMATVRWEPVSVRFTRVVCAGSMALALADPAAQGKLFGVVSTIEEALAAAGLGVRVRFRAEQAPFHASLFSAEAGHTRNISGVIALAESTVAASGSSSLNAEPIIVDSFCFNGKTFHAAAPAGGGGSGGGGDSGGGRT
jgi:hypothetical protein